MVAVAAPLPWMDLAEPEFDATSLQELYEEHVADTLETAAFRMPCSGGALSAPRRPGASD